MKIILVVTLFLGCCASTCKKESNCHKRISFVNNSNTDVYVIKNTLGYPDTNYYHYDPSPTLSQHEYKVNSKEITNSPLQLLSCYEDVMKEKKSDTLMVFVFDAQVLETLSWDTVKAKNLYLKRYELSLQDLKNRNFTITYP